jgi:hypothetical protein
LEKGFYVSSNYFFISPSYPPAVAPQTISSLDFDYKAWNLPEEVLKVLPKEVATFVISGRFKKIHESSSLPSNFSIHLEPLGGVFIGATQESLFHQQVMLKKLLAVQLNLAGVLSSQIAEFVSLGFDDDVPEDLMPAQFCLTGIAQLIHYFNLISEKRGVKCVSFITNSNYKPGKLAKERVVIDPLTVSKNIIKSKALIESSRKRTDSGPQSGRSFNNSRNSFGQFTQPFKNFRSYHNSNFRGNSHNTSGYRGGYQGSKRGRGGRGGRFFSK